MAPSCIPGLDLFRNGNGVSALCMIEFYSTSRDVDESRCAAGAAAIHTFDVFAPHGSLTTISKHGDRPSSHCTSSRATYCHQDRV